MLEKVADPTKIVTDELVLRRLAEQGIDKDYVEFCQDYALPAIGEKEKSPYAKFYRDLKSGKRFAVISRLPMVNALGEKCEAGWLFNGIKYTSKANQFNAEVTGNQVTVGIFNDQPTGVLAGASLAYAPTVYKGTKTVKCGLPTLINDPLNENYLQNTLEWDYGICKRRLRLIEGQIQGSWVFATNPQDDVKFVYNQSGDFRLKLGQYATDNDTEFITKAVFDSAEYPFTVGDTYTAYPDADAESTTVDGEVQHYQATQTWATIRNGAGTGFDDSAVSTFVQCGSSSTTDTWYSIERSIFLFDVTSVPDTATDVSAVESFRFYAKYDGFVTPPNIGWNIYSSTPASNTALAAGDYDSLGTTAWSATILYAAWAAGYNDFTLNAAGLSALNTAIAGANIFKTGARDPVYDVANSPPTWSTNDTTYIRVYTADQGAGYKPKLVVTYTSPPTPQAVGGGAVTPSATLGLLIKIATGAGSIAPSGVLGRFIKILVGSGSITPTGALVAVVKFFQSVGQGAITPIGTLGRKIKLAVGSGSITPASVLGRLIKIAVGSGAITPAGALSAVVKFFQNVGSGSVAIAGTLGRVIKITIGAGVITPASTLGRKIFIAVGAGSITPTGALASAVKFFQSVGQGIITPIGALGRKIKISVGGGAVTPVGVLASVIDRILKILSIIAQALRIVPKSKTQLDIESSIDQALEIKSDLKGG